MNDVVDAFIQVLPRRQIRNSSGWISFQCPACGDHRWPGRGGFLTTPSGGFRYSCFNGGCEFQISPTGWEPGGGLGGRPRRLFELLGGDILDIPHQYLIRNADQFDHKGDVVKREELEAVYSFPEIDLPEGSQFLAEVKDKYGIAVKKYLTQRGRGLIDKYPFVWSPRFKNDLIIPLLHTGGKIVGWIRRDITVVKGNAYVKCDDFPQHYMLNQHLVNSQKSHRVFVVEGPIDAIALDCLCTFSAGMSEKQINFLKLTGKDVVLVPDYSFGRPVLDDRGRPLKNSQGDTVMSYEWQRFLDIAKANNWDISTPRWSDPYNRVDYIKDAGEAIQKYGVLETIKLLVDGVVAQKNYWLAEAKLRMQS